MNGQASLENISFGSLILFFRCVISYYCKLLLRICSSTVVAGYLFQESKILNLFQINVLNNQISSTTDIFQNKFRKLNHKYPTDYSTSNYSISPFLLSKSKNRISVTGPYCGREFQQILKI